jgi:hypothetical protein
MGFASNGFNWTGWLCPALSPLVEKGELCPTYLQNENAKGFTTRENSPSMSPFLAAWLFFPSTWHLSYKWKSRVEAGYKMPVNETRHSRGQVVAWGGPRLGAVPLTCRLLYPVAQTCEGGSYTRTPALSSSRTPW